MSEVDQFKLLREETMENGQRKILTKEDSVIYRVTVFSADGQDWDWIEDESLEECRQVFELVTDMNDLGKV